MADGVVDSMAGPMAGRTVVVTGAAGGIGLATAIGLARLGATVALTARDAPRGEAARQTVELAGGPDRASLFLADLSSLAEVRRLAADLAARLPRIDVLLHNAGAMHASRKVTPDGLELTFAANHLAPWLLTRLLWPRLVESRARVVSVASEAHRMAPLDLHDLQSERGYSPWTAYGRSKLCNVLFAAELARRAAGTGVTSNSLHPGVVATGFGRNDGGVNRLLFTLVRPFLLTAEKGARTSIHVASAPALEGVTGRYFKDSREATPSAAARDERAARGLWEASARLTGMPA
jgi:NAD(P)-dependent dehydrogenase (short-subunit alcohol dehydrogenase family)